MHIESTSMKNFSDKMVVTRSKHIDKQNMCQLHILSIKMILALDEKYPSSALKSPTLIDELAYWIFLLHSWELRRKDLIITKILDYVLRNMD